MKTIAVRHVDRADPAHIAELGRAGTATVHEAIGRTGLLQPYMRPIYPGATAAGSAITVLAQPGDNWMLHVAAELCQPGDLLVVACTTQNYDGMFGDLLATSLVSRGVVGLVIDAGCRDIAMLREMQFPVWSRAVSAKGTVKATLGAVNVPVVCAGALILAGDVVVADEDGVVVVPRADTEGALTATRKRIEREEFNRKRLAAGELGLDIYNMRDTLANAGLIYVDHE